MARHIGILDSGIGGLSVLQSLAHSFPAHYTFLADTKYLPYGGKSPEFLCMLLQRHLNFFLNHGIDHIIIACHTLCTVALPYLDKQTLPCNLYGITDPLLQLICTMPNISRVGVLATQATIDSHYYANYFSRYPQYSIIEQACPALATLIETDFNNHTQIKNVINDYLRSFSSTSLDALILGCTHYHFIKNIIQELIPVDITIISGDMLQSTAFGLSKFSDNEACIDFYVTGPSETFISHALQMMGNFKCQFNVNSM